MKDKILNHLRLHFGLSEQALTAETSFRRDLAWDEIDLFEALFNIEQLFEVEMSDQAAQQIDNVTQLVEWLQNSSNH